MSIVRVSETEIVVKVEPKPIACKVSPKPINVSIAKGRKGDVGPQGETGSRGPPGDSMREIVVLDADYQLVAVDEGKVFSNRGAGVDIVATLPPGSELSENGGEVFRFRSLGYPYYFRISASLGDTIRIDSQTMSYLRCARNGGCIELEHQGDGLFVGTVPPLELWLFNE